MNKLIGLIMQTCHGKYVPVMGWAIECPEDGDQFLSVVGTHPPQETIKQAQALIVNEKAVDEKLLVPVSAERCTLMGTVWLNSVRQAQ